jgi:hypothetical protein
MGKAGFIWAYLGKSGRLWDLLEFGNVFVFVFVMVSWVYV